MIGIADPDRAETALAAGTLALALFVTLAVVPSGNVLLAALLAFGSMRVPSAISRPVNISA